MAAAGRRSCFPGGALPHPFPRPLPLLPLLAHSRRRAPAPREPGAGHIQLFIGLNGTVEQLGFPASNLWVFPSLDHDANMKQYYSAPFLNTEHFPALFFSFPAAKDPTVCVGLWWGSACVLTWGSPVPQLPAPAVDSPCLGAATAVRRVCVRRVWLQCVVCLLWWSLWCRDGRKDHRSVWGEGV
jgi:hypothetical protein